MLDDPSIGLTLSKLATLVLVVEKYCEMASGVHGGGRHTPTEHKIIQGCDCDSVYLLVESLRNRLFGEHVILGVCWCRTQASHGLEKGMRLAWATGAFTEWRT